MKNSVLPSKFGGVRNNVPRAEIEEQLRDFINSELIVRAAIKAPKVGGYYGLNDFIVANGCFYDYKPLPKGIMKDVPNYCFGNALKLVARHPELTYCEGIGITENGILPVYHGWAVTPEGVVIDPTWQGSSFSRSRAYLGVPISFEYAIKSVRAAMKSSVIDQWERDWPMLRGKPDAWLPKPLMEVAA